MKTSIALLLVSLASCQSMGPGSMPPISQLSGSLGTVRLAETSTDITSALTAESDLAVPFALAVAPPIEASWRGNVYGTWSSEERAKLRAWADEWIRNGTLSRLEILPSTTFGTDVPENAAEMRSVVRSEAAAAQADAVLVFARATGADPSSNVLAILDLTLIGGFIFPGHSVEVRTITEVVLLDTRNGFQYATGYGEASDERSSTGFGIAKNVRRLGDRLQAEALERSVDDLLVRAGVRAWSGTR